MFGSGLDIEHPFGDSFSVRRTRVRRRRLSAVVLAGACVVALSGPVAKALGRSDGPTARSRTHVVAPGDTLWSIARDLEPSRDPRDVVFEIAKANGVDPGSLLPGQELVIPAG
jgi:nucleoid-associated protein YgaU